MIFNVIKYVQSNQNTDVHVVKYSCDKINRIMTGKRHNVVEWCDKGLAIDQQNKDLMNMKIKALQVNGVLVPRFSKVSWTFK